METLYNNGNRLIVTYPSARTWAFDYSVWLVMPHLRETNPPKTQSLQFYITTQLLQTWAINTKIAKNCKLIKCGFCTERLK